MQRLKRFTAWIVSLSMMIGVPGLGAIGIAPAQAATKLICSSVDFDYSFCRVDTRGKIRIVQQLSRSPCIEDRTWGSNSRGIWVDRGCSAQFAISSGNGGSLVGAAIIGGIVGALLTGGSNDRDRHKPHYKHDYRDQDSPPPYDRYGSPNYDKKGRYRGCHGLGCTVDNPDRPDTSQAIDTRPQFDKDGNPNFDVHGNYIGCRGPGCNVDNPDAN